MVNASIGSYTDPFNVFICCKAIHVGFVWAYIAMFLCFLLGTPAHSWNFWLLMHVGFKIKPTQVFPLILIAVELLFCIHLPIQIFYIFVFQNITCASVTLFAFSMSWICRLLIQMCICIEQYLAVLSPVVFLRYKVIHYRITPALTIWIMASVYGLCLSFGVTGFPDIIFVLTSFTVMTVILFCYVSVLRALRHSGPRDREVTENSDHQKRNASNAISAVLLIIVLSYLPLVTIGIFNFMKMELTLFYYDVVPAMLSINIYSIMVPSMLKLYKGHRKCLNSGMKITEDSARTVSV